MALFFLSTGIASGHHAREYIEVEGYETIPKGNFTALLNYNYFSPTKVFDETHWEITATFPMRYY